MVSLQFITHQTDRYTYFESALMALEGGCKWIQLRMKEAPCEEVEAVALQLKPLCKEKEAILLLDDHVELAKKLEVDGVHLGKKDMPIDQARQLLGEAFIIGGTANTFEDVVQHYRAGADYLGIGPFRFTTTKKNLSPVLGLKGYTAILRLPAGSAGAAGGAAHAGLRQLGPYPSGRYGRFRPDGGRGLPCHCHRRAAHL